MKQAKPLVLLFVANVLFFVAPEFVFADPGSGLIPCTDECGFNDMMTLLNTLLEKAIEWLVLPIFIILLMYAGFKYITAGGDPSVHGKVRSILKHAVLGLVLVLCAWLIVKVILSSLGYNEGLRFLE